MTTNKNKNYLLSLYEHCRELAYLVSESESISRGMQLQNEPVHVISNNVVFDMCRLRRASAASFKA